MSKSGGIMAYNDKALSAYKETRVKTASQGSLILMLYDEGIKQVGIAAELMSAEKVPAKDIEKINDAILRAQKIVTELMVSLDMEAGGEIAQNLFSIYSYFNQELLHANMQKKPDTLRAIRGMLEELRVAWGQVVKSEATGGVAPVGINIAG